MPYLYGGKILRVDLTKHEVKVVPTERYASKYMGGRAVNARMLYEAVDAKTDPLGPDNILCIGTGPLTGTVFPGCSRADIMCKSPVTGFIGDANIGGEWPAEIKNAGWDHIVLEGKSEYPVYVYIRNDVVEIRDARPYWGMTTFATQAAIRKDLKNQKFQIGCIGPAGENQVCFGAINCGISFTAARTGVGAVMGSKNCKAIVVRGTKGVKVADPEAFLAVAQETHDWIRATDAYAEYHDIGLLADETAYARCGIECGGHAHETAPSYDDEFDFHQFWLEYGYKRTGCTGCPVHCMEAYKVPGIGAAAIKCENYPQLSAEWRQFDMRHMFKMLLNCEEQGMDVTSLSTTFTWLMLLWDYGIIDGSITDGIEMSWGNKEAIEALFWTMVNRTGALGDALAKGMKATAEYIDSRVPADKRGGKSSYYWAMQINNNPMFGIVPRMHGQALAYAVGRRSDLISDLDMCEFGLISAPIYPIWSEEEKEEFIAHEKKAALELAGHPEAATVEGYKGKAALVHDMGRDIGICDAIGTCKWHTQFLYMYLRAPHYAKALSAGLGREVTADTVNRISRDMRTLERALECKMGRRRENDTIPEKEFDEVVKHGHWKGQLGTSREGLERMKSEYYLIRGWDLETGIPTKESLLEAGYDDIAADLAALGILPTRTNPEFAKAMEDIHLAPVIMDELEKKGAKTAVAEEQKKGRAAEKAPAD